MNIEKFSRFAANSIKDYVNHFLNFHSADDAVRPNQFIEDAESDHMSTDEFDIVHDNEVVSIIIDPPASVVDSDSYSDRSDPDEDEDDYLLDLKASAFDMLLELRSFEKCYSIYYFDLNSRSC